MFTLVVNLRSEHVEIVLGLLTHANYMLYCCNVSKTFSVIIFWRSVLKWRYIYTKVSNPSSLFMSRSLGDMERIVTDVYIPFVAASLLL